MIGKCPNVYAYTKALGEQLLEKDCGENGIPLVIVRPSIVTASLQEPFPGWIDNLNGPTGKGRKHTIWNKLLFVIASDMFCGDRSDNGCRKRNHTNYADK